MMRGILPDGRILVGLVRSSLDTLEEGHFVVSPAYDERGPEILLVFAETEAELRAKLTEGGHIRPTTVHHDKRRS